jgi:hypothetical protein
MGTWVIRTESYVCWSVVMYCVPHLPLKSIDRLPCDEANKGIYDLNVPLRSWFGSLLWNRSRPLYLTSLPSVVTDFHVGNWATKFLDWNFTCHRFCDPHIFQKKCDWLFLSWKRVNKDYDESGSPMTYSSEERKTMRGPNRENNCHSLNNIRNIHITASVQLYNVLNSW